MPKMPIYPAIAVELPPSAREEVSSLLFSLGARGIEERDAETFEKAPEGLITLVAHFDEEDRARIAAMLLPYPARWAPVIGDEWKERWKEHFQPVRIGRLIIAPPWASFEASELIPVIIDPGMAFGTGGHESTRLVLKILSSELHAGASVLDVGCGSGILSIAALKLGASKALAIDIEREALRATRLNAKRNGVHKQLRTIQLPLSRISGRFDWVLANIESRVLLSMATDLSQKVVPEGWLVLSGILATETKELEATYLSQGLELVRCEKEGDWVAMLWRKPAF
ncbi:MAG: 50S ribosomal protein L11 methyltransferase [Sandaracinaceae bacterium]|nr:50S ribosomal protein L11 methyltransferase [Sandaracinaceae bacterium]